MANKTFYSRVPHSTFICSKGTVTNFHGAEGSKFGSAVVADERVQNEIVAAIKAGGHAIMTEEQFKAEQVKPVQSQASQLAAEIQNATEKAAAGSK